MINYISFIHCDETTSPFKRSKLMYQCRKAMLYLSSFLRFWSQSKFRRACIILPNKSNPILIHSTFTTCSYEGNRLRGFDVFGLSQVCSCVDYYCYFIVIYKQTSSPGIFCSFTNQRQGHVVYIQLITICFIRILINELK